jgi:serine/threonine protein phosphatase PrpC
MTRSSLAAQPTSVCFESQARTHPGNRRSVNEDRVLDRPDAGLWAVADGMGGHQAGDVAAARVVDALCAIEPSGSGYSRLVDVLRAVDRVNTALADGGSRSGSTLVALLAHEGHYACVWAGDSRAYLLRDGTLSPITRDHSIVQQLIDGGALAESERRGHPSAHVITRAVGAAPRIELDQQFAPIAAGDIFLLCSDGLIACLDDDDISAALQTGDVAQLADRLLSLALARGAPDNVSVVVVRALQR